VLYNWMIYPTQVDVMMKAALMRSPGVLDVTKVDDVECPQGGALLRVLASAVCGTDIKMMEKGHRDLSYPRVPGHEVTAEILEIGADDALTVGDRVQVWPGESCGRCHHCLSGNDHLCPDVRIMGFNIDGGMTEMIAVRDVGRLTPIGTSDPSLLTLSEPLACCINAQEKLRVGPDDRVLVLGGGPMGCLNAFLARRNGAKRVMVSEPLTERLKKVPKGLFDRVASPDQTSLAAMVEEITNGEGVDVIIPCTPHVRLDSDILGLLGSGGRLCIFSGPDRADSPVPVDVRDMHYRELTLVGSYGNASRHNRAAVDILRKEDLSWMLTGRFVLDEVREAYGHASAREGLKAVVTF